MAARSPDSRGLFGEAVRAVLGSWPVLQIAVENGFGGAHSEEKAEWMVGAVDQYFHSNADLEQYEVEEGLSGMMNEEFDTIVEDGSLPQVAQQLCGLYAQCRRGETAAVREKIAQLCQKKYNVRANVQEVKVSDEDEGSGDEAAEAMDCEASASISPAVSTSEAAGSSAEPSAEPSGTEPEPDGWTVVRKKKK